MSRIKTLFMWELNDPLKVDILLAGMLLNTSILHRSYLIVMSSLTISIGTSTLMDNPGNSPTTLVIEGVLRNFSFWMSSLLFLILLGVITFRLDRDSGYANSLYSLPYSKLEIFLVKFFTIIIFSAFLVFLPFFSVIVLSNFTIIDYLPSILFSDMIKFRLIMAIYTLLYSLSIITLLSLLSPNVFVGFIVSFLSIFIPIFLNIANIPPALFILSYYGSVSPFDQKLLISGMVVPAILLSLSGLLIDRRDVK
ncbi:ABC transporter permease [Pyrococcus woesei]|uniref:ABC transporter permease n=1 Tax=Pyrococcus woesei TaxID=2262 RepID=UPI003D2EA0A7